MSQKKISYLNRDFDDYRAALLEYIKTNYPNIANNFNDASVGSWMIDLAALIGDNLSYHIDSVYNETNIETAKQTSSINSIARTNGYKVPGPKGSMVELKFSVDLPVSSDQYNSSSIDAFPNYHYAPILKAGTRVRSNGGESFETVNDIDFSQQFNEDGISNREVEPYRDSNGRIRYYRVSKTDIGVAGKTEIYKIALTSDMVKPFMEITIPEKGIMDIESIIVMDSDLGVNVPSSSDFSIKQEFVAGDSDKGTQDMYRFFEVDSLLQQYRWGDDISTNVAGNQDNAVPETYYYGYYDTVNEKIWPTMAITRGAWIPLTQKFITEYTDTGYLKITFGSGEQIGQDVSLISDASDFSKYRITKMIRNNFLGVLPKAGMTMYIKYRTGGGAASNVAASSITYLSYVDYTTSDCYTTSDDVDTASKVKQSISVTNTTPSISGKDAPSNDEVRLMVKYNNASQERCVTLKDYETRLNQMPSRYGCAFRSCAVEENNKIVLYLLNLDNNGQLTDILPTAFVENVENYLSNYRSLTDFVEIKPGRIINIAFNVDVIIDKNYNKDDVGKLVINKIEDYMDVSKHFLGEDIFVGNIMAEICSIDGVYSVSKLEVYNKYGDNYSPTTTSQTTKYTEYENTLEIDLDESLSVLSSEADEMFEIKYPSDDITIRMMTY